MLLAFCTGSVTTFASDGHTAGNCAQCGEPNDGHVGAITKEINGEEHTFCCPSCATKYANAHHKGHHEHGEHHEHEEGHHGEGHHEGGHH